MQAAIAGSVTCREHRRLSFEAMNAAIDVRRLRHHARVVDEVTRREVVGAVDDDGVTADQTARVAGFERLVVQLELDVRIDRSQPLGGRGKLGPSNVRRAVNHLTVQVRLVDGIEIDEPQRPHAAPRPDTWPRAIPARPRRQSRRCPPPAAPVPAPQTRAARPDERSGRGRDFFPQIWRAGGRDFFPQIWRHGDRRRGRRLSLRRKSVEKSPVPYNNRHSDVIGPARLEASIPAAGGIQDDEPAAQMRYITPNDAPSRNRPAESAEDVQVQQIEKQRHLPEHLQRTREPLRHRTREEGEQNRDRRRASPARKSRLGGYFVRLRNPIRPGGAS